MPEFKPFDRVLMRSNKSNDWFIDLFSHQKERNGDTVYWGMAHTGYSLGFKYCIPYEGNECLLGTKDMPSEKSKDPGIPQYRVNDYVILTGVNGEEGRITDIHATRDGFKYDVKIKHPDTQFNHFTYISEDDITLLERGAKFQIGDRIIIKGVPEAHGKINGIHYTSTPPKYDVDIFSDGYWHKYTEIKEEYLSPYVDKKVPKFKIGDQVIYLHERGEVTGISYEDGEIKYTVVTHNTIGNIPNTKYIGIQESELTSPEFFIEDFKFGDHVEVRNSSDEMWMKAIYLSRNSNNKRPYRVVSENSNYDSGYHEFNSFYCRHSNW